MSDDQRQSLLERWTCFARETDAGPFARLLRELTRTADFQNSAASRQALGQRAADVLDALARDDELRRLCFSAAREGLGTCGDRVALTFSDIEVAARATTLAGKPDGLLKLAHGMHRLALVAGREVRLELAHAESRLRGRARATIATARARDADAQTARQNAQRAEADAQTRQVQAHAGQQERGPETASGGLPSTGGASPSVKQARPGNTTTQARSDQSSAEESAQTLTMPIVPNVSVGTTGRLTTRPTDR